MNLRIINDKLYHEYSATELDDIRHKALEDEAIRRGQWKFATSVFEDRNSTNPSHIKTVKRLSI